AASAALSSSNGTTARRCSTSIRATGATASGRSTCPRLQRIFWSELPKVQIEEGAPSSGEDKKEIMHAFSTVHIAGDRLPDLPTARRGHCASPDQGTAHSIEMQLDTSTGALRSDAGFESQGSGEEVHLLDLDRVAIFYLRNVSSSCVAVLNFYAIAPSDGLSFGPQKGVEVLHGVWTFRGLGDRRKRAVGFIAELLH